MKTPFRVIGDVHGVYGRYIKLTEKAEFSVQLGDMGLDYAALESVDPMHHRFVPGNHDNYDNLSPHAFQTDWGQISMGPVDFFYIRGAYSIDRMLRTVGIDWWEQEQMSWESGRQLVETIAALQPKLILSHDCPTVALNAGVATIDSEWIGPSITSQILQAVWEVWQPKHWVFGHHHRDWIKQIEGTQFICLNSLSSLDIFPEEEKMVMNARPPH
jgi:predicted phosphodiesterase